MNPICHWYRRWLERSADLETGLTAGSSAARHLDGCESCRAYWVELRRLSGGLLQAVRAPKCTDETARQVWARIEAGECRQPAPRRLPALGWGGLAAALLGVAMIGGDALRPPAGGPWESPVRGARPEPHRASADPGAETIALAPIPANGTAPVTEARPGRGTRRRHPRDPKTIHGAGEGRTVGGAQPDSRRLVAGKATRPSPGPRATRILPDEQFLDGRDAGMLARWTRMADREKEQLAAILSRLPPPADDFVRIPLPRVAAAADQRAAAAQAVKNYEQQAKIVDTRLYRNVSLEAKGEALENVCRQLERQTGVTLRASRGVADEKVTLFVKEVRARDLMRALARLFGYAWSRAGEEGAYRYELTQDLRSRLAEEELRNRDQAEALLALDAEMEKYRPYLELPFDQLKHRWKERGERQLFPVIFGGWGGMQLYHRLTPGERAALLSGQDLTFRDNHADPDRSLPAEWQPALLASWTGRVRGPGGVHVPLGEVPGIRVTQLRLRLVRSELGQLTLKSWMTAGWEENDYPARTFTERELGIGRSPSSARPGNAEANAALKGQPPFDRVVSVEPAPSCPHFRPGVKPMFADPQDQNVPLEAEPHLVTADVWEAVHRATGLPVVADFYSGLFPAVGMAQKQQSLFDALCRLGDRMGVRWTQDGDFLLGRSTSYYWDKLKEVPNRHLRRWRKEREAHAGLPLASLIEMAGLPDSQLNSRRVGEVVRHCWGLREWLFLEGEDASGRSGARFLSQLTAQQLQQARQPEGIPLAALTPGQQQGALQLYQETLKAFDRQGSEPPAFGPEAFRNAAFRVQYIPTGWYAWNSPSRPDQPLPRGVREITAPTQAEALAQARAIYPEVRAEQFSRNRLGQFHAGVMFIFRQ